MTDNIAIISRDCELFTELVTTDFLRGFFNAVRPIRVRKDSVFIRACSVFFAVHKNRLRQNLDFLN